MSRGPHLSDRAVRQLFWLGYALFLVLAGCLLVGCGGGDPEPAPEQPAGARKGINPPVCDEHPALCQ